MAKDSKSSSTFSLEMDAKHAKDMADELVGDLSDFVRQLNKLINKTSSLKRVIRDISNGLNIEISDDHSHSRKETQRPTPKKEVNQIDLSDDERPKKAKVDEHVLKLIRFLSSSTETSYTMLEDVHNPLVHIMAFAMKTQVQAQLIVEKIGRLDRPKNEDIVIILSSDDDTPSAAEGSTKHMKTAFYVGNSYGSERVRDSCCGRCIRRAEYMRVLMGLKPTPGVMSFVEPGVQ
ncbi:hypothetical protein LINPERPRIM_LOCUS2757 [Linum perenne]